MENNLNIEIELQEAKKEIEKNGGIEYIVHQLPAGEYHIVVDGVELRTRQTEPMVPYVVIVMHVDGGLYHGYRLFDIVGMGQSRKYAFRRLFGIAELAELDIAPTTSVSEFINNLNCNLVGCKALVNARKYRGKKAMIDWLKFLGNGLTIDADFDDNELNTDIPDDVPMHDDINVDEIPF